MKKSISLSLGWYYRKQTHRQKEAPQSSVISRGQSSPSVRLEDYLRAVPDGAADGPGLSGSLPITIKLAKAFLDSEGNIQLKIFFPQKQTKSYASPNPQNKECQLRKPNRKE